MNTSKNLDSSNYSKLLNSWERVLKWLKEEAFLELHADADFEAVDLPSIHDSQFIEACASAQNHKKKWGEL